METQRRPLMRTITVTNTFNAIYGDERILMTHESKWRYVSNPNTTPPTISIDTVLTTYREAGHENETIAEFDARHAAKVAAQRALHPPIVS